MARTPLACLTIAVASATIGYGAVAWLGPSREADAIKAQDERLGPREVVERQVAALSACGVEPSAPARVFALASPSNRSVTGPLERFAQMLSAPPFDRLSGCRSWTIGNAVVRDGYAAVLVTVVGSDGRPAAFRFYVSRQPHNDRWMTDGVSPAPMPSVSPAAAEPVRPAA